MLTETGGLVTDTDGIRAEIAPLGVELHYWPIAGGESVREMISKRDVTEEECRRLLESQSHYFERLADAKDYRSQDLIFLHDGMPDLDEKLAVFDRCHRHPDDEFRYIIDGEGIWGLVMKDGTTQELLVEAGEAIDVKAGTEHWFTLSPRKCVKVIRYFSSDDGWKAEYSPLTPSTDQQPLQMSGVASVARMNPCLLRQAVS